MTLGMSGCVSKRFPAFSGKAVRASLHGGFLHFLSPHKLYWESLSFLGIKIFSEFKWNPWVKNKFYERYFNR